MKNPFLTYGYNGPEYFCDRVEETKRLTSLLVNGNHVALMSPRRMGKTGLIRHCFAQQELQKDYYLFLVDIYATKSLSELIYEMGRVILSVLKSKERKAWERFIQIAGSLRTCLLMRFSNIWVLLISLALWPSMSSKPSWIIQSRMLKPCCEPIFKIVIMPGSFSPDPSVT